jgi:hypothetical protein
MKMNLSLRAKKAWKTRRLNSLSNRAKKAWKTRNAKKQALSERAIKAHEVRKFFKEFQKMIDAIGNSVDREIVKKKASKRVAA